MNEFNTRFEMYWQDIPVGQENAITYDKLRELWGGDERRICRILHELSAYDNGDNYILVRSGAGKGFYKTDDVDTINYYKRECLNKGRSVFAPVKKINRVLNNNGEQLSFENNLRVIREAKGFTQTAVVDYMRNYDTAIDAPMLSKMENGACLPTPFQLALFADFYDCDAFELVNTNLY